LPAPDPDTPNSAMWGYAVAMFAIAVIAEAAGLGGVPRAALTLENILFIGLVLIFAASALKGFVRRPRRGCR
jgi:uncharacterized membrane protein YtjA (UPF0391 family)